MAYTVEEIEKMRAAVAAADRLAANDEAAARVEFMKPIRDFVKSKVFTNFETTLSGLQPDYAADEALNVHINAILMILTNLVTSAEYHISAPNAPEPVEESVDDPVDDPAE